jgi:hypothetical protein
MRNLVPIVLMAVSAFSLAESALAQDNLRIQIEGRDGKIRECCVSVQKPESVVRILRVVYADGHLPEYVGMYIRRAEFVIPIDCRAAIAGNTESNTLSLQKDDTLYISEVPPLRSEGRLGRYWSPWERLMQAFR